MRVLHVCTEIYPLLKTGGLADVAAALPPALIKAGCDVRMLVPGFPAIRTGIRTQKLLMELPSRFGSGPIRLYYGQLAESGIGAYVIDAPGLYDRSGNPYADADNHAYPDNYRRFALLGWMAARLAAGLDASWRPQVVHGHDWHAGLAPAYMKAAQLSSGRKLAGSVFTIHNLAYQGLFSREVFGELDLPGAFYGIDGMEFYHQISFMKAGLFYSDKISTVSPTYAREIQQQEQGCGLDGLLHHRRDDLRGILNGVDPAVWNPATDPMIANHFDKDSLVGKLANKTALQLATGLAVQNEAPLFGIVSRLTEQKGLHLVLAGLPELLRRGGQIMVLGNGDGALELAFRDAALAHPESIAVHIGYNEQLSHRVIAGSDAILVPSRFEPCGLTQLYGLKYGTLPLVNRVGGLADTVVDCSLENLAEASATGFVFEQFNLDAYLTAIRRAFALYERADEWRQVQQCAMTQEFNWDTAAQEFLTLYRAVAVD
ncbi:MAG: glycogen synthase GlgA [Pseudomonadota bacterium]